MEVVLSGADIDAETADRWGLVNRSLPPEEVRPFVDALASRIGSLPAVAVAEAKASVLAAEPDPVAGLLQEWQRFTRCLADPESAQRMQLFLEAGGQTREVELEPVRLDPGRWG